jgi:hypothetical protein
VTTHFAARSFAGIDVTDLEAVFDRLNIESGSVIWVQSGTSRLGRDAGQTLALITALRARIGPRGAIFMPSFPFVSDHWTPAPGAIFDVRRTPSACGLLTEMFRRQTDVERSETFYFPVCGCGPPARELLAGQLYNEDVFGPQSVFGRLIAADAQFVGLGVGLNTSSFMHVPNWILQDWFPVPMFPLRYLAGRVRTRDGIVHDVRSRAIEDERIHLSFAAWQMMDGDPVLGPLRRVISSKNATGDVFCFTYPVAAYVSRAIELGRCALDRGEQPPWLKPGTFALFDAVKSAPAH